MQYINKTTQFRFIIAFLLIQKLSISSSKLQKISYWTIRRSVKKTLARHINEIQTQSSQENYGDITTHSPEYAGPSNIGESSNNLNIFDRKPRAEKKKKEQNDQLVYGDQ